MKTLSTTGSGTFFVHISDEAKNLIEKYDYALKEKLSTKEFRPDYGSVYDILTKKYNKSDAEIAKNEGIDYNDKTEFITDGVKGNLQKAKGNVLSIKEGKNIIMEAEEDDLP